MIETVLHWFNDKLFSGLTLGLVGGLLIIAAIRDAYEAWEADLPWFGWDLRRRRRWRFTDSE